MHKVHLRLYYKTINDGTSFADFTLINSHFYIFCWIVGKFLVKCMHLYKCENEEYATYTNKDYNIIISYW